MSEIASAFVTLLPSFKGGESAITKQLTPAVNKSGKTLGSSFGKVFSKSLAIVGGAAAIGGFLKDSIGEAREAQKVGAQTNAVLKSTGGVAGITAGQIGKLATSISLKTGIDDEAIQSSENLLLTFTNLKNGVGKGNDVFNQATKVVTDMSVALGTDAKNSAIQVGKALNDPIKGITALSRVGVSFTQQQKDQIAALVKSGDTMKAQKIILGELKNEFGGSAAAAATSGDKFKVAFGNLQETVGTALLPIIDKVATTMTTKVIPAISGFITQMQTGQGVGGQVAAVLTTLGSTLQSVAGFLRSNSAVLLPLLAGLTAGIGVIKIITVVTNAWKTAQLALDLALEANPIGIVVVALAALVAGLVVAYKHSETFRAVIDATFSFLKNVVTTVVSFIADHWKLIVAIIGGPLVAVGILVATHWSQIKGFVTSAVSAVINFVKDHWKLIVSIVGGPLVAVGILVVSHWGKIKSTVSNAVNAVVGFVKTMGREIVDRVQDVARFVSGLKDKFGEAVSFVKSIPGKFTAALAGLYEAGKHAAEELIRGLLGALSAGLSKVTSKVSEIAGKIKGFFPGSPVKEGPLTVWNDGSPGKNLMGMLAKGLADGAPAAVGAAEGVSTKINDALQKMRDSLKSKLDGIKSDFSSLSDSIASAFTSNLFGDATTGAGLVTNLTNTFFDLHKVSRAFKKLRKEGLSPAFLSQLFATGNTALILDLASGPNWQAQQAASLYTSSMQLSSQIGNSVARDQYGAKITKISQQLDALTRAVKQQGREFGREINGAVSAGARRRV